MDRRVAELVLKQCLGHRPGETLLVVTDNDMHGLASVFYQTAIELGIDSVLLCMPARGMHGAEPPPAVAKAMCGADLALLITRWSLSHTDARRAATESGARIASMPGVDGARLGGLLDIDYEKMGARAHRIAEHLTQRGTVRVVSPNGTDLTFRIPDRPPMFDLGLFRSRGEFGNLPAGEVFFAPEEGTAAGVLVVDGSMAGIGRLDKPIRFEIRDGFAVEVSSLELRKILEPHGREACNVAEFGIGLNPNAEIVGNILEDEKVNRTIHIAFGNNKSMGGTVGVKCHLDGVCLQPEIFVDGKAIPRELLDGPEGGRRATATLPGGLNAALASVFQGLGRTVLFETLFENSNDAQYILDIETQTFVLVNHAFEMLSGYTREELLSGKVRTVDIIATESQGMYASKREERREVLSDRYDIQIVRKSGDKVAVEVSVRKMRIAERDIVVGALRDLTERVRMLHEIKKQKFDMADAANRIYALTEKIKNVPKITPTLLNARNEEEILKLAADTLCDRRGLSFMDVTFYMVQEDQLIPAHTTLTKTLRKLDLRKDHPFVQVLRGEARHLESENEVVYPLTGRERTIGLVQIFLDPKEKKLIDANERARIGYLDLLRTLADQIGLILDNARLHETVRRQSIIDQLTGVFNRRHFDVRLNDEIRRAHRYSRPLSMILIDLDSFKQINDTHGHRQGDVVLSESAKVFQNGSRDVDVVCRYGGDEFVFLLPETDLGHACLKADQVRRAVLAHQFTSLVQGVPWIGITLSLGVASVGDASQTADQLLRCADEAMYFAKRGGKNSVGMWKDGQPQAHKED